MNSISAQNFNKRPRTRGRFGRILPATLIILLLTAVPALAEPVTVNHVVQTLTSSQGTLDLRLNTLVQDPAKGTQQNGPRGESVAKSQGPPVGGKTESLISGVVVAAEGTPIGVEDIGEGEVEGTICDCGEIFIAGGAFPKWPLLFLAAVPVVFIHDCDDCDEQTDSTPTPTPPSIPTPTPTTPTPEPASLLLFGSGLLAAGAGLRRRYGKSKSLEQIKEDQ